jgi:glycine/D-amino acid oxidase-like deaminating enzyme
VRRRIFLAGLSGWALTGLPRGQERAPRRIVVIGGGIVGAGIAYRLARRGAEVTLLERDGPAAGATSRSFAWLNAHYTKPLPRLVSRVVVAEKAHLKQYADGRVVLGDDFGPPKTTEHAPLLGPPQDFPNDAIRAIHAQRLVRQAREYVAGVNGAPVERVTLGWRPMPADGLPVTGFLDACPNAYVVVTHSGVTLAAVLGQLVTAELLDRVEVLRLDPYRPARFA